MGMLKTFARTIIAGTTLLAAAVSAHASDNPAFDVLADQVVGELGKFTENYERVNSGKTDCRIRCVNIAYNSVFRANRQQSLSDAGEFVVLQAERAVKIASAATGVGGVTVTGYSVMRCSYDHEIPADFWECVAQQLVFYKLGEGLPSNVTRAVVERAADEAVDKLRDAQFYEVASREKAKIISPAPEIEQVVFYQGCKSVVRLIWDPRPRAGYRGGVIIASATADSCEVSGLNGGRDAVAGYQMRGIFPLKLAEGPGGAAGMRIDRSKSAITFVFKCAGGGSPPTRTFNMAGRPVEFKEPAVTPKSEPAGGAPKSEPKSEQETAAEAQAEKIEDLIRKEELICELCKEQEEAYSQARKAADSAQANLQAATKTLNAARYATQQAKNAMQKLEAELAQGAGETVQGSGTDADGNQVQQVRVQRADGTYVVETRKNGNVISQSDVKYAPGKEDIARKLQQARKSFEAAQAKEREAEQSRVRAKAALEAALAREAAALKAYHDCIERARCKVEGN